MGPNQTIKCPKLLNLTACAAEPELFSIRIVLKPNWLVKVSHRNNEDMSPKTAEAYINRAQTSTINEIPWVLNHWERMLTQGSGWVNLMPGKLGQCHIIYHMNDPANPKANQARLHTLVSDQPLVLNGTTHLVIPKSYHYRSLHLENQILEWGSCIRQQDSDSDETTARSKDRIIKANDE